MSITRVTRFVLAVALLLGIASSLSGGASAQDENIETWESDVFPITVTYNADLWKSRSVSTFESDERFQITARATNFLLQAFANTELDAEGCLGAYLDSISEIDGISGLAEADDAEMPDGLRDGAEIVVMYDFLWAGREQPVAMIQYLACHEFEPGSLVLIGIETRAGIYEEELEIINAILAGVELDA